MSKRVPRRATKRNYVDADNINAQVLWPKANLKDSLICFDWTDHLTVTKTTRQQRGVFASRNLKPNTLIPHLGLQCLTGKDPIELHLHHVLDVSTKNDSALGFTRLLNGYLPWCLDHNGVSSWGACITMMLNEPGPYTVPNCILTKAGVIVSQNIVKGTELTVLYSSKIHHQFADEQAYTRTGEHWITNEINAMWYATQHSISQNTRLHKIIKDIFAKCTAPLDRRILDTEYTLINEYEIPKSKEIDHLMQSYHAKLVNNLKSLLQHECMCIACADNVCYRFESYLLDGNRKPWYWADSEAVLTHEDYWYDDKFENADIYTDAEPILSPGIRCKVHTALRDNTSIGNGLFLKTPFDNPSTQPLTKMIFPVKSENIHDFRTLIEESLKLPYDSKFDAQKYSTFDLYFVFNRTPLWYTMNCSATASEDNVTILQPKFEWKLKNKPLKANTELIFSYNSEKDRKWPSSPPLAPHILFTVTLITLKNTVLKVEKIDFRPGVSTAEKIAKLKSHFNVPVRVLTIGDTEATVTFWPKFHSNLLVALSSPELSYNSDANDNSEASNITTIVSTEHSQLTDTADPTNGGIADKKAIQIRCAEILTQLQIDTTNAQQLPSVPTGMSNREATKVIFIVDSDSDDDIESQQDVLVVHASDSESAHTMSQKEENIFLDSQTLNGIETGGGSKEPSGGVVMLMYTACEVCGLSPL